MKVSDWYYSVSWNVLYFYIHICRCVLGHDVQFISYSEWYISHYCCIEIQQAFVISPFLRVRNLGVTELRWFSFRISHEVAVKLSARAVITWKLDWDWRICFQDGALTWLESWWWLSGWRPHSLLRGPYYRVALVPLQYGSGFPQKKQSKTARKKWQCVLWLSFRNHIPSFLPYLAGNTDQHWYNVGSNYIGVWIPTDEAY